MKKPFFCFIFIFIFIFQQSCSTVEKFNSKINSNITVKNLHSDIEYIQKKLLKLHPDLYHYITKDELNFKFDSLKKSIISPMTSYDFYFKLSPVIASIRQGHTQTFPLTKRLTQKEKKRLSVSGKSPLNKFEYELFDNQLYIVKNNSKDTTIKVGSKVLSVNGIKTVDVLAKYKNTFSSDGYNSTFNAKKIAKSFPNWIYFEDNSLDSVDLELFLNDSIHIVKLNRAINTSNSAVKKTKEQITADKLIKRNEDKKRKLLGYDTLKQKYSKMLCFHNKDSNIAIMKISDFSKGNYRKFYKMSFDLLDSLNSKTLIIDLRDNPGGRLTEVKTLFSYLTDSTFHFIQKSEVTSKTSLWHDGFFCNKTFWQYIQQTPAIPFVILKNIFTFFSTSKGKDDKYRIALIDSWKKNPNSNRFKGDLYVLINGGSFSASSLIASNLKATNRATFVGEETGGADNGCVAGKMPIRVLPNSKLKVIFGLLVCQTPYEADMDGRGVFPTVQVYPTLSDRLNKIDPEMNWVLNKIETNNSQSK